MILLTLDTGALIAMERRKPRAMMLLRAAREHRARLCTITPVLVEWWSGRTDVRERIRAAVDVIPFPARAAEAAGIARARSKRPGASVVDWMVMAFAATLGGSLVYTSDIGDSASVRDDAFPNVRVLGV